MRDDRWLTIQEASLLAWSVPHNQRWRFYRNPLTRFWNRPVGAVLLGLICMGGWPLGTLIGAAAVWHALTVSRGLPGPFGLTGGLLRVPPRSAIPVEWDGLVAAIRAAAEPSERHAFLG